LGEILAAGRKYIDFNSQRVVDLLDRYTMIPCELTLSIVIPTADD